MTKPSYPPVSQPAPLSLGRNVMKHDFGLNYMIQKQWSRFPKLMREIPSMSLKTSNTFKRSIYILYLESIEYSVDHSLHAVFIISAGIWCSL